MALASLFRKGFRRRLLQTTSPPPNQEERVPPQEEQVAQPGSLIPETTTSGTTRSHDREASSSTSAYENRYTDFAGYPRNITEDDPVSFSYQQLEAATENFSVENHVGEGGFGRVYKGTFPNGQRVAVKYRLRIEDEPQFITEVLLLSILRHPNIINMVGYCSDGINHRAIVYEFMKNTSLEDRLYGELHVREPLDWDARKRIAIGSARALNFLHHQAVPPVICREFKSANILLDERFEPKLSDFGISRFRTWNQDHVQATTLMGTLGYCAPECARTGRLTNSADVYSFGVVLLELVTSQRAMDETRGDGVETLVNWVRVMLTDGANESIADPGLRGQVTASALRAVVQLALRCCSDRPDKRPSMHEVAEYLADLAPTSLAPEEPFSFLGTQPDVRGNMGMFGDIQEEDEKEEEEWLVRRRRAGHGGRVSMLSPVREESEASTSGAAQYRQVQGTGEDDDEFESTGGEGTSRNRISEDEEE